MVANGQLETPKSTVELKFEVGDIEFHCKGETNEYIDWSLVSSTKQYYIRYETRNLKFSVLLHAIGDSGSQVHQRYVAYLYPRGYHHTP